MRWIWTMLVLLSLVCALFSGQSGDTFEALLQSGAGALRLTFTLTAAMGLWGGLMAIADATGDTARLGRLLRRVLHPLFPGIEDEDCWSAMGMNMAANMLGLGNAATPAGIEAAKRLTVPGMGENGVRALAMLLALNNSSLEWMPTTVMTLRSAAGAANPADIWLPTLLSSGLETLVAAVMMLMWNRRRQR